MLSPEYRLRSSRAFGRTVRHGRKKGSRTVVAYVLQPSAPGHLDVSSESDHVSRETLSPKPTTADSERSGVHLGQPDLSSALSEPGSELFVTDPHPRVGLVVSKAVGNAVARHGVSRQLRHAAREALTELEGECAPGTTIVLRALPPSSSATHQEIKKDVHSCIRRALK